jgi:ubiquinone/menaquinone biosynthesis C-methylase UbiE
MTLFRSPWHQRYQQQAEWTQNIRNYIYNRISLQSANKILDVGCGTGVLEKELNHLTSSYVLGLDIDLSPIKTAQGYAPNSIYTVGDSLHLPFSSGAFDLTLCHFLLMWVSKAMVSIEEMVRVTHPKGYVIALAEPDYGGRIDYPLELTQVGLWQIESLKEQGANPFIGRELRSLFTKAGLKNVEVGVLGGQWGEINCDEDFNLEWHIIQFDLSGNKEFNQQAEKIKELELNSRQKHRRILYVPTFYAFGMVRENIQSSNGMPISI